VIAALLPEAGPVGGDELDPLQPLGALASQLSLCTTIGMGLEIKIHKIQLLSRASIYAISWSIDRPAGRPPLPIPIKLPQALSSILDDIKKSLSSGLYYPALLISLTLPDICCSLSFDKERFVKETDYVPFVDKYTTPRTLGLDGKGCFRLRGGMIHRADASGHPHSTETNVVFSLPKTNFSIHALSIINDNQSATMLSLETFCQTLISAVHTWYTEHHTNPYVISNLPKLIRYMPSGMPPFVEGVPVVASGK
jgi:hypothetical protein